MKALSISTLMLALALCLAATRLARSDDSATPEMSESDRELIELNKVLVIPQKCTPTDGTMTCDPNAAVPDAEPSDSGSVATAPDPSADPTSDADVTGAKTPDADPDATASTKDGAGIPSASADPSTSVQDISNPDVPLPADDPAAEPSATASNDSNAVNPEYGTLEDYQQTQQDVVMVPVPLPLYAGAVYGTGPRVYYPSPIGGMYAVGRVTTSTYTPPFGAPGPWLSSPRPFGRAPGLGPAPHALAFHHR
jgi:hypothetical protein